MTQAIHPLGEGGLLQVLLPADFGQSPVDDERLAVVADHDVLGLEIAMHDPAAVGIGHRLARIDEVRQQLHALFEGLVAQRALQVASGNEPHHVVQAPV